MREGTLAVTSQNSQNQLIETVVLRRCELALFGRSVVGVSVTATWAIMPTQSMPFRCGESSTGSHQSSGGSILASIAAYSASK